VIVFVVYAEYAHDGAFILGVRSTLEGARLLINDPPHHEDADWFQIESVVVDGNNPPEEVGGRHG
jgi:hypothetical protein